MPFTHQLDENTPEDGPQAADFQYQSAKAKFKPAKLSPVSRLVLEALAMLGATHLRVGYDGGNDEGFAHPDFVTIAHEDRPVISVAKEFADSPLIKKIRDLSKVERQNPYAKASDQQVADYAIYNLAHELACTLLGAGYGTGEYMLYGAFTANLVTGEILDDPKAPMTSSS